MKMRSGGQENLQNTRDADRKICKIQEMQTGKPAKYRSGRFSVSAAYEIF